MVEISPPARTLPLWRFSLAEMLGGVAVVAFCFSFWRVHPVTAFFAFVLLTPTALQTMRAARICKGRQIPLNLGDHWWNFAYSLLIVVAAGNVFLASLVFLCPLWAAIYFALHFFLPGTICLSVSLLLTGMVGLILPIKYMNRFKLRASLRKSMLRSARAAL